MNEKERSSAGNFLESPWSKWVAALGAAGAIVLIVMVRLRTRRMKREEAELLKSIARDALASKDINASLIESAQAVAQIVGAGETAEMANIIGSQVSNESSAGAMSVISAVASEGRGHRGRGRLGRKRL